MKKFQSVSPHMSLFIVRRLISVFIFVSLLVMTGSYSQGVDVNATGIIGDRVFFASGLRIGEVTQTGAIVWTRLTAFPQRNWDGIIPDPPASVSTRSLPFG